MKYKTKLSYEVSKDFYKKLIIYFIATAVLGALLIYFSFVFSVLNGDRSIDVESLCPDGDLALTNFYCWLRAGQESKYFDFIYYGCLIMVILSGFSILVLNAFYISNRFYFKHYIRENSYGAVIYRIIDNKIEYLIEEMTLGHVSLCKGHVEQDETPEQTALREISEETNLAVELDTNFHHTVSYHPSERIIKYVTFFIAESINKKAEPIDRHDNEIKSSRFVSLEEAIYNITYDDDRETIIKASRYICKHKLK